MGKYLVRTLKNAPQVIHSSCGESRRLITSEDTSAFSLHIVHIFDGKKHYHKRSTETYYVLEEKGNWNSMMRRSTWSRGWPS